MSNNPENYMDRFETPEEFIRAEILANRGSNNIVDKSVLLEAVGWKALEGEDLSKLSKAQLFDRLVRKPTQMISVPTEKEGLKMKPLDCWSMEAVFIITGIGILVIGTVLGLLGAWLQARGEKKGRDRK